MFSDGSFLKQRPKILHFSGRGVGGAAFAAASGAPAVDSGIQLADGVLASRDFSSIDLSRCMVVVLSCSWVSVEDLRALPALVSALMAAGAWTVVASTCNVTTSRHDCFLLLQLTCCQGARVGSQGFPRDIVREHAARLSCNCCLLVTRWLAATESC
jgi:hypothetical protein